MANQDGQLWFDENGSLRGSGQVALPFALWAVSQRLQVFLSRLAQANRSADNSGWLSTAGLQQLWDQTTKLALHCSTHVLRPRPPLLTPGDPAVQMCDFKPGPNSVGLAECLNGLIFMLPYNGDGTWVKVVPDAIKAKLVGIAMELDQHAAQLRLCNPDGIPPDLDASSRLCWRLEVVVARAADVQAVAQKTIESARRAEREDELIPQKLIVDLTRARWAYLNAIEDAETDIEPVVSLIGSAHAIMRHRVGVELRVVLSELRAWDQVAQRAPNSEWSARDERVEFPDKALQTAVNIQSMIAVGGWSKSELGDGPPLDESLEGDTPASGRRRFIRHGKGWDVTFDGKTGWVPDLAGFGDLVQILRQPNPVTPISALVLKPPPAESRGVASERRTADPAHDPQARQSLQDRYDLLMERKVAATEAGAESSLQAIDQELADLADATRKSGSLGGRIRGLEGPATPAARARKAVRKRIDDAIESLRTGTGAMPSLAHHLQSTIKTDGDGFAYRPGQGAVAWDFD